MLYYVKKIRRGWQITWASHVKEMLYKYGFGYVWIAQDVGNSKQLLGLFTQRLKDCFLQDWFAKINESSKAEHYKCFKSLLDVEKYLGHNVRKCTFGQLFEYWTNKITLNV